MIVAQKSRTPFSHCTSCNCDTSEDLSYVLHIGLENIRLCEKCMEGMAALTDKTFKDKSVADHVFLNNGRLY